MAGSAIRRRLSKLHPGWELITRTRDELNLLNQVDVHHFLASAKPDLVIIAAAKVGGILANDQYRAEFLYENLMIEANLIHGSFQVGVRDLLFLGSSCIYPRDCPQPIKEDALMTGPLESTNEAYAIAKIAGVKLCQSYNAQYGTCYRSLMPTNLYGPRDNYDLHTSHVLPALIRKAHEAKIRGSDHMVIWGSGHPRREFLHVDDLADACVYFINHQPAQIETADWDLLNIGTGSDVSIAELARYVADVVGFSGELIFDASKPDGTPRKVLDVSKASDLGWTATITLQDGLEMTYQTFLEEYDP